MNRLAEIICVLALFSLAACSGSNISNVGAGSGTLASSSADLTDVLFEGVGKKLRIVATPNRTFDGDVYVQLIDRSGILRAAANISELPDGTYEAILNIRPLSIGRYQGKFEVRLCKNEACSEQYSGSPLQISFDFDVRSHTQLSPLTALMAPDWTATQGGEQHTGYVPVTLDASRFSPRWLWKPSNPGDEAHVGVPVTQSGTAYLSASSDYNSNKHLVALDEVTGAIKWQYDLGYVSGVYQPTVGGGRVFIANADRNTASMWGFDAVTGNQLFRTPFSSQGDTYSDPIIYNGKVYTAGGYYGGMYSFDAATGAQNWFLELNQIFGWSPTVANGQLLVPIRPSNRVTGTYGPYKTGLTQVSFDGQWLGYTDDNRDAVVAARGHEGWSANGAIAAADDGSLVAVNGVSMTRFNAVGGIAWQLVGDYVANPAVAGNEVFAVRGGTLEARSLTDSTLLWSWTPEATPYRGVFGHPLVVTNNLIFFATDTKVFAVDRSSHKPVWSYPMSGNLALSAAGILYIQLADFDWIPNGILAAVSLN